MSALWPIAYRQSCDLPHEPRRPAPDEPKQHRQHDPEHRSCPASTGGSRMTLPMSRPDITSAERAAVLDVLSGATLALGPRLELFERRLAAYVGAPHGVAVSSGTAGLHLCVVAAGVGEGDAVLTTPFSFVASANCVLYERALPIFIDIDPVTLTIEPNALEAAAKKLVARRQRPKAILPVHVFGHPADMDPIRDVARRYGVALIEDAC